MVDGCPLFHPKGGGPGGGGVLSLKGLCLKACRALIFRILFSEDRYELEGSLGPLSWGKVDQVAGEWIMRRRSARWRTSGISCRN